MAIAALFGRKASRNREISRLTTQFIYLIHHATPMQPSPSASFSSLTVNPVFSPLRTQAIGFESYKWMPFRGRLLLSTAATSNTAAADSTNNGSSAKSSEDKASGGERSQGSEQGKDGGKSVRGGPVSWMSFFLLLTTGIAIIVYYDREKKRHIEEINKQSLAVKEGPSAGKAAIGGPFNLINHEGKPVKDKDFVGKWTLIYFGFTHCPDICPAELEKLAGAVDKIKNDSGIEILPVFISVDPERDTVEQVREYVKGFHQQLVGLTGSPEEIKKAARAYRVYYMKTEEEDSDYLVDHSIVMYLMSPKMEFVKFFGKNNDVNSLAEGVVKEVKRYTAER